MNRIRPVTMKLMSKEVNSKNMIMALIFVTIGVGLTASIKMITRLIESVATMKSVNASQLSLNRCLNSSTEKTPP